MMRQRIYVDTSVIGGYYDEEFREWSELLFDKIRKGEIIMVYSEISEQELFDAPQRVRNLVKELPQNNIEYLEMSEEANTLADKYISENVVGMTSKTDCLHIALATIHKVDVLVSWNFKHIVNIKRIRGYNGMNILLGYSALEIRTPKEILTYD
jgi:hypothetical protein